MGFTNINIKEPANYFRNVIAIVLVLPNVFIVSHGIAKCIRKITRGSVMHRYLMTNELV